VADGYGERGPMSDDWDEVGYVISSTYRIKVLQRLSESAAPTSKIAEDIDCANSHVSRALSDLRERGLVDLLVPESRKKGRIYGITDRGREIWETIEAQNLV
jgi:DNA-binding MarR family transcriptional regulator